MNPVDKFPGLRDVLRIAMDFTSSTGIEEFSGCDKKTLFAVRFLVRPARSLFCFIF
jgi:hypothetical protein